MPRVDGEKRARDGEILDEFRRPDYGSRRRERARRRKSAWNILLFPLVFALGAVAYWILIEAVWRLRGALVPAEDRSLGEMLHGSCDGVSIFLMMVAPLFAALPIGMLAANALVWCVPPARRALDREGEGHWHASFAESQRDLLVIARWLVPCSLAISAGAAWLFPLSC
jgi:hypothetical protein